MRVHLGRVITAMVTPFKTDLSVDYGKAQSLARYLLKNGSDGLVVAGTTGESPTLSSEEKLRLFEAIKETVGDQGSVIAGTGNNCTRDSVELTKKAEEIGVNACMLVTPYYNKPPQSGLFNHFKTIAKSTSLPVILYNVPSRTVRNLNAETVIALSKIENIVAVKEASGDMEQIARIIQGTPEDFLMYSGEDATTFSLIALGGYGVISVASHFVGKEIKEMIDFYQAGSGDKARQIHLELLSFFKTLFATTNPILVKAALKLKGFDVGGLRPPLIEASEDEVSNLKLAMEKMSLL